MQKVITVIALSLFTLTTHSSYAANFPKGCHAQGYQFIDGRLKLNDEGNQTLYLIKNHSKEHVKLKRYEEQESFMAPSLRAKLLPRRWAAFASDVKAFEFSCSTVATATDHKSHCDQVLSICQYPRVKFATSNMGNYWVSINKSLRNTMRDAIRKGILLRW